MTDDFIIRPAAERDVEFIVGELAALLGMEQDFTVDCERQERGVRMLMYGALSSVFVAESSAGALAGSCSVQLLVSTAEGAYSGMVEDLVVEEPYRKCGLGGKLLLAAQRWAEERGATRMQLLCDDANVPAQKFYHRAGWSKSHMENYFFYSQKKERS